MVQSVSFLANTVTLGSQANTQVEIGVSAAGNFYIKDISGNNYVNINPVTKLLEDGRGDTAGYNAQYVIVAGGGAGGTGDRAGGGGAGGLFQGTTALTPGTTYNFVIGAGGAGITSDATRGTDGNDTTAFGFTAIGGGGGGSRDTDAGDGGSGGGASTGTNGAVSNFGSGTVGQGNDGGTGTSSSYYGAGGGGGFNSAGGDGTTSKGGDGGDAYFSNITGQPAYYAGGGGGAIRSGGGSTFGLGGNGVGGDGTFENTDSPTSAVVNTGSGGGGSCGSGLSGSGSSGLVILRIPTGAYSGTTTGSPTVTTDGVYTILKFTASGSYTA